MGTRIAGLLVGAAMLTSACGGAEGSLGIAAQDDVGLDPALSTVPGAPSEGGGGSDGSQAGMLNGSVSSGGRDGSGESQVPEDPSSTTQAPADGGATTQPPATPSTTAPPTTPSTTAPPTTAPPTTAPSTTAPSTTEHTTTTTAPPMTTVSVTFIRFHVIKDCDGIEGLGDFDFQAILRGPDGNILLNATNTGLQLDDNGYVNNIQTATFSVPATNGQSFAVEFLGSEWDKDVFGKVYTDDRMDRETAQRRHVFADGAWSGNTPSLTGLGGTYPAAIQLGVGSGNCFAEFQYVMTTS